MKTTHITPELLERFIASFLPEGKLIAHPSFDLRYVSKLINTVLNPTGLNAILPSVFDSFYRLRYPMSVVEPLKKGENLRPYIDTNSHTIYIAIEPDNLEQLDNYTKSLQDGGALSAELTGIHELIQHFFTT